MTAPPGPVGITGPRIAAVYPTDAMLWVVGERCVAGPVNLYRNTEGVRAELVSGPDRDMGAPFHLVSRVDDPHVTVDGIDVEIGDVLREVLAAGLVAAGMDCPVDVLALVVPPHWGTPRRRLMERAGRAVADDVVLVDAAVAAVEVVDADVSLGTSIGATPARSSPARSRPARPRPTPPYPTPPVPTLVVACSEQQWVVSAVVPDGEGPRTVEDRLLHPGPVPAEAPEGADPADIDRLTDTLEHLFGPDNHPIEADRRVVMYDSGGGSVPVERIARAVAVPRDRPWAEPLQVTIVSAGTITEVAYDTVARSMIVAAPQETDRLRASASWLNHDVSAEPDAGWVPWWQRRLPRALLVSCGVVLLMGSAVSVLLRYGGMDSTADRAVAGSPVTAAVTSEPTAAPTDSPVPSTDAVAAPVPTLGGADVPAEPDQDADDLVGTTSLGRVRVDIPIGWEIDPQSDRIEFRPTDNRSERIVVQSVSVAPGIDINRLRQRLEEQSASIAATNSDGTGGAAVFDSFEVVGSDPLSDRATAVLHYRELPIDGSVVRWRVVLHDELQVSIGCQRASVVPEPASDLEAACDRVLESLVVRQP